MKSGLTPLWNERETEEFFDFFTRSAVNKEYEMLVAGGEKYVEVARKTGNYQDHTGNLRASVGYVIYRNGKEVASNFVKLGRGTDEETGIAEAKRLANKIAIDADIDMLLVCTAGMNYAASVEAKGYDVGTTGAIVSESYMRDVSRRLFERINRR